MAAYRKTPRAARPSSRPAGPSEIAPDVFVGGWKDATNFRGTRFCVLDEEPDDMPEGTHIQIYDESTDRAIVANLDKLAKSVAAARARNELVLMFCPDLHAR